MRGKEKKRRKTNPRECEENDAQFAYFNHRRDSFHVDAQKKRGLDVHGKKVERLENERMSRVVKER